MKTCSRCKQSKSLDEFTKRSASKDGRSAACTECLNKAKRIDYILEPEKTMVRVHKNHKDRLKDVVYRRAWNQWRYARELKLIPKWVSFSKDMLPVYRRLLANAPDNYQIDHVIPLKGTIVTGLHVPSNLQIISPEDNNEKSNHFHPDIYALSLLDAPHSDKI